MELNEKINLIRQKMEAVVHRTRPNENLSDADQLEFDMLKSEYEKLAPPRKIDPGQPGGNTFSCPATAKKYTCKNFKDNAAAYSFGHYLMALGGRPQSVGFCRDNGIDIYASAHSEGSNTGGGYLVPPQFERTIIDLKNEYGVFRRHGKVLPMSSDQLRIPRRSSGLTPSWTSESGVIAESCKTWNMVELNTRKLGIITRMTKELADDAIVSVADDLIAEIAYAFAQEEDRCGFTGTGLSTDGGITGVCLQLQTVCEFPTTTSTGGISIAAGDTFAEITMPNLLAVMGILQPFALRNAKWFCSSLFYNAVMLRLAFAEGGVSANDVLRGAESRSFLGYPVVLTETMPRSDGASQIPVLFGDLAMCSTLGDRLGSISIETSGSAVIGGESVFEREQIALRGTERLDIVVHDVGTLTEAGPIVGLQTLNS